MTKEELEGKYPDNEWRRRLLLTSYYVNFLEDCILRKDYKIPDSLNNSIVLTSDGIAIRQTLITKHQVPAKEATIMCFLATAHVDMLVDLEKTDFGALHQSIHRQIVDGDILHPFMYGRELYDRAAGIFPVERNSLSYEETLNLLDATPRGVFQLGDIISGPYGLQFGQEARWIAPTTRIPLYHCADLTCQSIHPCYLTTDHNAAVNDERPKINRVLRDISEEPSAWRDFIAEIAGLQRTTYDDKSPSTLIYLLGDCLSVTELHALLARLLTGGADHDFRAKVGKLGIFPGPGRAQDELTRAHCMQLILMAPDATIIDALDRLIATNTIRVPAEELRIPMVNQNYVSGSFGLQPQISHYGTRFHSIHAQIGPLRLRRLVDQLYLMDEGADTSELEWQLRGVEGETLQLKIAEFVRSCTPEEVLRRLVLSRRTNMIAACTDLSIDEHRYTTDADLIGAMLWKLGFSPDRDLDSNARFWQLHDKMKHVTQTAGVSAVVDQEAIRALASNYFVMLEELLDDSLAFVTWALTTDHIASPRPYRYRSEVDRIAAFQILNTAEEERESESEVIRFSEKNTLYPLCRGFQILARHLEHMTTKASECVRSDADLPEYVKHTTLKKFAFVHDMAFLDLTERSQRNILSILSNVSRVLVSADVNGVRNDQLHFNRSTADLERLISCLAGAEEAVRILEQAGFTRLLFHPLNDTGDEWSRRIYVLADPRGREIAFARPSSYDWLRLPGLRMRQYLMISAVFAEPNEILRFRSSAASEYSTMWDGYPTRRKSSVTSADIRSDENAAGGASAIAAGMS
ncbi:hypothetical protein [Kribbella sp. NPDC003557]|uniref:hypothetical protein n=1 Tax=Kribbella sp. NPDC003557 TaxID=3154449 RepID=UPI0033A7B330